MEKTFSVDDVVQQMHDRRTVTCPIHVHWEERNFVAQFWTRRNCGTDLCGLHVSFERPYGKYYMATVRGRLREALAARDEKWVKHYSACVSARFSVQLIGRWTVSIEWKIGRRFIPFATGRWHRNKADGKRQLTVEDVLRS